MSADIVVALLGTAGTIVGSFGGVIMSSKLVNYRLQMLEEKVNKHNNIIERTFRLEGKMDEVLHDIEDIERRLK